MFGSQGYSAVLAAGWRTGNPDGWHFGLGLATELPRKLRCPNSFDAASFTPGDVRSTKYDNSFMIFEAGYGALEFRALNVVSDTYRGINTGGVCGTLLQLNPDPMVVSTVMPVVTKIPAVPGCLIWTTNTSELTDYLEPACRHSTR